MTDKEVGGRRTTTTGGERGGGIILGAMGVDANKSGTTQISATDFGYTGQRDYGGDFGLMDYRARFYSPRLGRFTQPDTIVPDAGNPQAWNRFTYVLNNPLVYSDPTGHFSQPNDMCDIPGNCDEDGDPPVPPSPSTPAAPDTGNSGGGGGSGGGKSEEEIAEELKDFLLTNLMANNPDADDLWIMNQMILKAVSLTGDPLSALKILAGMFRGDIEVPLT